MADFLLWTPAVVVAIMFVIDVYAILVMFVAEDNVQADSGIWLFGLASSIMMVATSLFLVQTNLYLLTILPFLVSLVAIRFWRGVHAKLIEYGEMVPLRYWGRTHKYIALRHQNRL